MTWRAAAAIAVFLAPRAAHPPPAPSPRPPPPPLSAMPSIARVKIEARGSTVIVTEDVSLPRGDWKDLPLDFHVAFGAPGTPRAVDAHLLPVGDGELEADDGIEGEVLSTERVPRKPNHAHALLGRPSMAGIVVHIEAKSLTRAFEPGGLACLRIRYVHDVTPDARGVRRALVRLGAQGDKPLAIGRIVFAHDKGPVPAVSLCGPDADTRGLAFSPRPKDGGGLAPILASRRTTDDLCVEL